MKKECSYHPYDFTKAAVARNFDRAAKSYDGSAMLHNIVGERLFERLDLVKIAPELILDLGSGTGHFARQLQKRYKKKKVLGLDLSKEMSLFANKQRKWLSRERYACADAEALPLADNSVDLVFSNLMIQWLHNPDQLFREVQRILVPGGLLMFTSFGPDTLKEMRQSWYQVDKNVHVNRFIDMHDIGDSLTNSGFAGTVMDNEAITMTYEKLSDLHSDLRGMGENNINSGRNQGMTGKELWNNYLQAYKKYCNGQGDYPATWEITYGHAWATEKVPARKTDQQNLTQPFTVQDFQG